MDARTEIRDFLTSRRARITPQDVGLPVFGGTRRVKGLRREEVATLAGVSVDYYNRMERGNLSGASESVLEALARALQLDEAEHAHLFDLARASQASAMSRRRRIPKQNVRPSVQWMLDAITGAAAFLENGRLDALAANPLGRALYSGVAENGLPSNWARFVFLDPHAREFHADWDRSARDCVALLRSEAGRDPYDRDLSDLVGELSTRSDEFRTHWAAHNVRLHNKGVKKFIHPVVGELELSYERVLVAADHGLTIMMYAPEPHSRSAEALSLLGSWAATEATHATEHPTTASESR